MNSFEEEELSLHRIQNKLNIRTRKILGEKNYRKNAILIPLIQTKKGLAVVFEQRAKTLRKQAGEICFPGGHIESHDHDPLAAAIRETSEELNIPVDSIQYIGDLDILVTHSQLMIYPYVGMLSKGLPDHPNPAEVDHLFAIELTRLQQIRPERYNITTMVEPDQNFPFHLIPDGKQYSWRTGTVTQLFYLINSYVIWGLTARILSHFLEIMSNPDS